MRLLIAEDQHKLLDILKQRLIDQNFQVDAVPDGEQALSYIESSTYDAIILDIMMPYKTGLEVLYYLRSNHIQTPVLLLTAKDQISDRVKGLNMGADDYLVKPFHFDELIARINVLLRRQDKIIKDELKVADLIINRTTKTVKRHNIEINLSKKEYNILEYLMLHKDEVVSRDRLETISTNFDYEGYSNVIDVYIRFLRKKIDEPFETKLIHTVRGFGYQLGIKK